jgi:hypothetical protein
MTTEDRLTQLESRHTRLAAQHRRLRRLLAVALVGFASLAAVAAARPEALVTLVADHVTVIGKNGKPAVEATSDGNLTVGNDLDVGNTLKVKGTDVGQALADLKKPDGGGLIASGYVTADGVLARSGGAEFAVVHQAKGCYDIVFKNKLPAVPVVVATSEGGREGCDVRVVKTTAQGFTVEGRNYGNHSLGDTPFGFVVVRGQ